MGAFTNASNWTATSGSPSLPPGALDEAIINSGTSILFPADPGQTLSALTLVSMGFPTASLAVNGTTLTVGNSAGGRILTNGGVLNVYDGGTLTLLNTSAGNATISNSGSINLGFNASDHSTLSFNGAGATFDLGNGGTGSVTLSDNAGNLINGVTGMESLTNDGGHTIQGTGTIGNLASFTNNGTLNSSDVQSVSTQISGILDEVESLANTSYQGQYIFAGGQTSTAPFSTSTATSPAVTTYNGDQNVNYLESPNGQRIQLNVPGGQIFLGSGSNSVFGALNSLVADYSSGTVDTAQAVSDTEALSTALSNVSKQRVTIDNSITQATAASDAVSNVQTQLTAAQTNLMQADIPTVSTQLSLSETQQTALEDVIAQLNSSSNDLFSKLPE